MVSILLYIHLLYLLLRYIYFLANNEFKFYLKIVNSLQCYSGTSAYDEENERRNCTSGQTTCVSFIEIDYWGVYTVDKRCFAPTAENCNPLWPSSEDCYYRQNGCIRTWTNFDSVTERGTKDTCFCNDRDLCNGSSILSVNQAIIGILVLFYFLN